LNILAFETSTEYCSLALWFHNKMYTKEIQADQQHSKLLLPMLQKLLAETEVSLTQLDGIAFGAGPGSFTGLRIACGVAQGIAFANDLPIVGISTLKALAHKIDHNKMVVALDARMHEIYYAAYTKTSDDWQTIIEPVVCPPSQAPLLAGDNWIGCGSGFDVYKKELSSHLNGQIFHIHTGLFPHAQEVAQLAIKTFQEGSGDSPDNVAPIYVRNKVALKENER
jgi:tRNA threonylcarbamoyladenosine biosynthesis protein TsaB